MKRPLPKTLTEMLVQQAEISPESIFTRFLQDGKIAESYTYAEAWGWASRWATLLQDRGLKKGEPIVISLPNSYDFVGAYFGTLLAGGLPAPIVSSRQSPPAEKHLFLTARRLADIEGRIVILPEDLAPHFHSSQKVSGQPTFALSALDVPADYDGIAPQGDEQALGLLQFTSGTTGRPKVVALSQGAILAQTTAIAKRLQIVDPKADWAVSWLPLFHDMGLIGFLLTPASLGGHVTFLRVEDFIMRPSRWIQALSDLRATITGGPPSAYALCARRVKDHELGSYDLSQLRVALVGAEQIMREPIDSFADRFAAAGFQKSSLLPTYGLAENGLAVTMPRQNQEPLFDAVDTDSLRADRFAKPISLSGQSHFKHEFVSVGVPLLETEVVIADKNGRFLDDRQVGEILVRSPSLMKGYLGRPDLTEETLRDGWLWTGDLGYLAEGNLYITGRKKEVLIVGGQNFSPISIEQVAGSVPGVRQGKVAAFSYNKPELGTEVIVALIETRLVESRGRSELRFRVRKALVDAGYPISDVVLVRPKTIETTPNGKVKRNDLKKRYMEGEFSRAA